jgi:phage terminase small subunit
MKDVVSARDDDSLSAMQEAFAVNFATNGGQAKQAAIEAGYSETTASQQASRLRRNPLIAKRIAEECMHLMAGSVPQALAGTEAAVKHQPQRHG